MIGQFLFNFFIKRHPCYTDPGKSHVQLKTRENVNVQMKFIPLSWSAIFCILTLFLRKYVKCDFCSPEEITTVCEILKRLKVDGSGFNGGLSGDEMLCLENFFEMIEKNPDLEKNSRSE